MSLNMMENSSGHVQNTIRIMNSCIAVEVGFYFMKHIQCVTVCYVTVRTEYRSCAHQ